MPELVDTAFHGRADAAGIVARLADALAGKTRAEWETLFAEVDACCEPVLSFSEVRAHPHWQARCSFLPLATPDGRTLRSAENARQPGRL